MAVPGTVNYFEGQVSVNGIALDRNQLGYAELDSGGVLDTGNGKAEVLLSPGVILRAGSNSEVRMLASDIANTHVEVTRGEALIEVDQKSKDARVDVTEGNSNTALLEHGLYRFDANQGLVQVIDGKANLTVNGQSKDIGGGKEIALNAPKLKAVSFDRKAEDDLYRWSSVRSDYLAEANVSTAQGIYAGAPYWGPGWYWNPYFTSWAWLPGDGYFYGPFGYPFFSVGYAAYAPYFGFYGRGGYYRGAPGLRAGGIPRSSAFVGGSRGAVGGGFRGGFAGGGFHGGGARR